MSETMTLQEFCNHSIWIVKFGTIYKLSTLLQCCCWLWFLIVIAAQIFLFLILLLDSILQHFAPAFMHCLDLFVSDRGEWEWAAASKGVGGCPHGPIGGRRWARIRRNEQPWRERPYGPPEHDVACTGRHWPFKFVPTKAWDGATCSDGSGEWAEWKVLQRWGNSGWVQSALKS